MEINKYKQEFLWLLKRAVFKFLQSCEVQRLVSEFFKYVDMVNVTYQIDSQGAYTKPFF